MDYLEEAIGAMLMSGAITFEGRSWAYGVVEMVVRNNVFTEEEFFLSVSEDDWEEGPAASVAKCLAKLIREKEVQFRPIQEQVDMS